MPKHSSVILAPHEDPLKCPLDLARSIFKTLSTDYNDLEKYPSRYADIIQHKYFESGNDKLQVGDDISLYKHLSPEEYSADDASCD